jgi:ABC-type transport system involved in cytochrome c biogenesis permease subunit
MPTDLAELSRFLYSPVTILLYGASAVAYLYALTTTVGRGDQPRRGGEWLQRMGHGRFARLLGAALAIAGLTAHLTHEVTRAISQQRFPLGNMFEFTSAMALVGIAAGLIYLQFVRKRPELNGFVMMAGTLVTASALLVYARPAPLQPILDTYWRHFHVSLIVSAAGILTAGFVFTALYLLRDTAERRVHAARDAQVGSTVGAADIRDVRAGAPSGPAAVGADEDDGDVVVAERVAPDHDELARGAEDPEAAYRDALRGAIPAGKLALYTFLGTSTVSWVFIATPTLETSAGIRQFLAVNVAMVLAALVARRFVPYLPPAATLDALAYRTIALGFFLWTFGVIAGAMWAEQSWGRFWGWDPKETGSFLTWVAYAAYLHARATRGARGRGAGWIGLWAFAVLMFTYYGVNLVITGLHSYAGL